jgi:tetratricopeptide (TPR) repeat protein
VAATVQRLAPDSYPQLQRELERHNQTLDATARALSQFERLVGEADLGVLLAEIPKAPRQARDVLYQQAAWKALGDGDAASARRIATELVSDEEGRGQLLSQIERQEVRQAILRGELPEVRQLAPTWQSDEDATAALVELASVLAERGRKDDALRALGEARALLGEELNNPAQFGAALELAGAYAKLDPEQAFGLMDRLVNRVNEMVAAGAVLNGFVGQRHSYLGGSLLVHAEGGVVNSLFLQCVGGLLPLARADFERAADLAERFNAPETSASAKVLLAKLYLMETNSTR